MEKLDPLCVTLLMLLANFDPMHVSAADVYREIANGDEFPYIGIVKNKTTPVATGALIGKGYVLTSKSSLVGLRTQDLSVILGHSMNGNILTIQRAQAVEVSRSSAYDAAIITLKCQPILSDKVQPIAVGTATPPSGEMLVAAGWETAPTKSTSDLQKIHLSTTDTRSCVNAETPTLETQHLCAEIKPITLNNTNNDTLAGSCSSYPGGPIVRLDHKSLVGMLIEVKQCPNSDTYLRALDLSVLNTWISDTTASPANPCTLSTIKISGGSLHSANKYCILWMISLVTIAKLVKLQ